MSKRTVGLMAILVCIALSVGPLFAAGQKEGVESATGFSMPWAGEEVVWDGFAADLGMKPEPDMPVVQAYRATTGNASIEWTTVPWNDYDTKMNLYLQSGDMPDIMWCRESVPKAVTYGPVGLFLDWDKYKEYMPNMQKWVKKFPHLDNILTDKGERFAINDIANADYIGEGWFYNAAITAKAGFSAPPKTTEELFEQMKKVKAVSPDTTGYISGWGLGYIMTTFGTMMNVKGSTQGAKGVDWDTEAKKWIYGPTMDPNYKKLIEYLRRCYEHKLFSLDALGNLISDTKVNELITEGDFAFTYFYYSAMAGRYKWAEGGRPPEGYQGMPTPSFEGKTYYWITVARDTIPYWGYMANAKTKNPELLAAYMDNVMSEETSILFEWGLEGQTFSRTAAGGIEYLPGVTPDQRKALGVYNFWDPRFIHYMDRKLIWFGKDMPYVGEVGRAACAADIKRCRAGEYVPLVGWPRPLMSGEQNDEIGKIMTPIKTFVEEQQIKFMTGDRDMAEWDDFVAQVKKMGDIDKVLSYYNGGKQFPMGERAYPTLPPDLQ